MCIYYRVFASCLLTEQTKIKAYALHSRSYFWTIHPTDLQNVNITLRILFRPVTTQLPRIFTSIGEDYDERVLPSITTEVLKAVVVSIGQKKE